MSDKKIGTAMFIYRPRTLEELRAGSQTAIEKKYSIIKIITLPSIDYCNFITDMLADRLFIEENEALCSMGNPWECLLVKSGTSKEGVLIMPQNRCYVGWAAFFS